MKLELDTNELLKGLEIVSRISAKHQTLPILQCVLCVVSKEEKTITLKTTNLEVGVEVSLSTNSDESGMFAVPSTFFMQTVQLLSEKKTILTLEGESLVVANSRSHTNIKTFPHEEFPQIAQLTGNSQTLNGRLFSLGIKSASFATSQSSIKPELGSIYIHQQKEHSLTFVATDAFRLVEKTVPQKSVILENSLLIPSKNALELARVCELVEEDPQIIVSENQCALRFSGGVYITTRLTEASFPDYQQIIPKEFSVSATILRGDLVHALKKTNIFANAYLQVRMGVKPDTNTLECVADNGEFGKTEESISATIEGGELSLSFNQRYLTDPLMSFTDDSIVLRFAGVGRPMVIEGVSEKSLRYLIMPMNR